MSLRKSELTEKLNELKRRMKTKQEDIAQEWKIAQREWRIRQTKLKSDLKRTGNELSLGWDEVQEKTKAKVDDWLDKLDAKELEELIGHFREDLADLELLPEGAVLRQLPARRPLSMSLEETLQKRSTHRDFSGETIPEDQLAAILWACDGVNGKNGRRTTPSAMNWQDVSVYVVQANGIWKYLPKRNVLLFIEGKDHRGDFGEIKPWLKLASQHLVFVSDGRKLETLATKLVDKAFDVNLAMGEWGERVRALNVGVKIQAVYLACSALGVGCAYRLLINENKARQLLKLSESEKIMAICSIGDRPESLLDHTI